MLYNCNSKKNFGKQLRPEPSTSCAIYKSRQVVDSGTDRTWKKLFRLAKRQILEAKTKPPLEFEHYI